MTTALQQAAQAVIDRWDSPSWKDQPHTSVYIAELRKAIADEQAQAVEPASTSLRPPRTAHEFRFGMEVLNWNRAQQDPPIDVGRELWVADEVLKLRAFNEYPAPPPAGDRASLIRRADASVTALNSRIMEPFYCSLDQNAARVLSDCVDMLESDAAHMAISNLAGNAETMSIANGMILKLRAENKALKAQQVAAPLTILERARAMYAEFPTYRGTKPLPWGNVGNDVRREWLDKARAQQVAAPVPMTDSQISDAWESIHPSKEYPVTRLGRKFARAIEAHHGITQGAKP